MCCAESFYLVEVIVGLSLLKIESLPLLRGETCQHLVEDVIVPLIFGLKDKHKINTFSLILVLMVSVLFDFGCQVSYVLLYAVHVALGFLFYFGDP